MKQCNKLHLIILLHFLCLRSRYPLNYLEKQIKNRKDISRTLRHTSIDRSIQYVHINSTTWNPTRSEEFIFVCMNVYPFFFFSVLLPVPTT